MTPRTFDIARRCVEAGADPQWIARTHYDSNSLARVRIFGAVMNGMTMHAGGRVALLAITRATMSGLGATADDLEGLINFPLTVKDIQAAAFFKEVADGDWRVSLRSKGDADVGAIAQQYGGGGHRNAAGCSVRGELGAVQAMFAERLDGITAPRAPGR
jgi:phosphoesterase RecJ-like protein